MKEAQANDISVIADASIPIGLTSDEVNAEIKAGHTNKTRKKSGKSYGDIVVDNLLTIFNLICAVIAFILLAFGSYINLSFLFIVVPNVLLALISEIRAKRVVDKISVTTDPRAIVVRDGKTVHINAADIVLGDVMRVEISRQILADGVIISGSCEVNESMLTGESIAVRKQAGDRIFAGSFVVSGSAFARVDKVGDEKYVNTLERAAKGYKAPVSNLFRSLNRFTNAITILMVPMTIAVAICNFFVYKGKELSTPASGALRYVFGEMMTDSTYSMIKTVVEKTSASVVAMIPAGMYLLITITLSLSVIKLAKRKTLVQDMYSIEMLARADILCLDKTGTITDGSMEVSGVIPLSDVSEEEISSIMSYIEGFDEARNATSRALVAKFGTKQAILTDSIAFSSSRKYSAYDFMGVGVYALGAPHFVPAEVTEKTENIISEHTALGERVILLARLDKLDGEGEPLALITLADRIRPGAKGTIARFQTQDVTVKVISGDHAETVSAIAKKVGIKNADNYISCENLTDDELCEAAFKYAVFGRVTPEQKVLLIRSLKDKGHTVAMTGDGVNDTLALKEANCAIAMADGSEVARAISEIVLLDSDFSHLPEVVREGRRCVNNVRNSASLFVMKTIFSILVSLFSVITVKAYPFETQNLMFLEFFVIGTASFLLAFEPNERRIEGGFLQHVLSASLPYSLSLFMPVLMLFLIETFHPMSHEARDSIAMLVVSIVGYLNLTNICRPYTKWRMWVVIGIGSALTLAMTTIGIVEGFWLHDLNFNIHAAFSEPMLLSILLTLGVTLAFLMHLLRDRISEIGKKIGTKIAEKTRL